MMKEQAKEAGLFFFSQSLADGLRITIAVLFPALVSFYLNLFELGMTISLGALCVSLVDAPGPIIHRRNTMLFCFMFIFIAVVATGYARLNIFLTGLEVLLLSFFFSMFTVYGLKQQWLVTQPCSLWYLPWIDRLNHHRCYGMGY